ncbi:tyrosine-type recombinase/integrase [Glaesserella parasuis]|uniref:Tyrosine-type recombinase/integrase n=1 Tax=Glaesserella parasuis TaxID=738 RepID=A0A859IG28_GLAPU|nr:tyrosine-type recombinase/integrase [Glaesserella parasuis]MDG6263658.1 tyrosine-type recombinase/integrase [Glaesserella parasuis]MDG6267772.1 tyrosine-type recombinase/integrase [Glaesserella parasuis]MDG6312378.1 tyrosine-type recombinase/integrase [Glaesserella parasuis]MDG6316674.1 tyrosine-type recombinase/integrase [Glaesserella parasuis]MDG6327200.1 tyrosine-type recombinase/integrase [Glaesserella parasuis]
MGVRKDNTKNGKWLAEFYKNGKRIRRWFDTKGEASRFFNAAKNPLSNVEILTERKNDRPLLDLVNDWFELHGRGVTSGEHVLNSLKRIANDLGNPTANKITPLLLAEYRSNRLAGKIGRIKGVPAKPKSINTDLSHLRAMFNTLAKLDKFDRENPVSALTKLRENEPDIFFLRSEQIPPLLKEIDALNYDAGVMARICLATGARWGEVENLTASQVVPYKLTFTNTKSKKNRTVPISKDLFEMLPKRSGKIFNAPYIVRSNLHKVIEGSGIIFPKGKATHVFRHTFASHFMMNGGNILVLKDILGHSDIKMTMRYAHFSPSHLESAVTLNPLTHLK